MRRVLFCVIVVELETKPSYTTRVVVKVNVLGADHAFGHEMLLNPALHSAAGGIDGGVFKAPRTVAGPVVRRLGQRRRNVAWRGSLGQLHHVQRGELIVGGAWLRCIVRLNFIDGAVARSVVRFARSAGRWPRAQLSGRHVGVLTDNGRPRPGDGCTRAVRARFIARVLVHPLGHIVF